VAFPQGTANESEEMPPAAIPFHVHLRDASYSRGGGAGNNRPLEKGQSRLIF